MSSMAVQKRKMLNILILIFRDSSSNMSHRHIKAGVVCMSLFYRANTNSGSYSEKQFPICVDI